MLGAVLTGVMPRSVTVTSRVLAPGVVVRYAADIFFYWLQVAGCGAKWLRVFQERACAAVR